MTGCAAASLDALRFFVNAVVMRVPACVSARARVCVCVCVLVCVRVCTRLLRTADRCILLLSNWHL